MIENKDFLIETDILQEHLIHHDKTTLSYLELAMTKGVCYTTVINSSELFFASINDQESKVFVDMMKSLKVLGLNARYSLNISHFFNKVATVRDALICSVAKHNNLSIFTTQVEKFKDCGLEIINPNQLR